MFGHRWRRGSRAPHSEDQWRGIRGEVITFRDVDTCEFREKPHIYAHGNILLNPVEHKAKQKQRDINVGWRFHGRMREDWWEQGDKKGGGKRVARMYCRDKGNCQRVS